MLGWALTGQPLVIVVTQVWRGHLLILLANAISIGIGIYSRCFEKISNRSSSTEVSSHEDDYTLKYVPEENIYIWIPLTVSVNE